MGFFRNWCVRKLLLYIYKYIYIVVVVVVCSRVHVVLQI
jgi:hypothetical protein